MNKLALAKKIASWLLLLCFVLPLSKCAHKVDPDTQVLTPDNSLYAYAMALKSVQAMLATFTWDSAANLLAIAVVFFLPAAALKLSASAQAALNLAAAFAAAVFIWMWTFLFRTPQVGGLLAAACWGTIFVHSSIFCWGWLRASMAARARRRAGASAA